jgi:hypothetical protein
LNPSQSDEELSCIDEIANGDCWESIFLCFFLKKGRR